ncbi:hypothetical protein [Enterobacter sp. kpr-6]|uniref:hypothetical protein n=1 Tax=Enterobacter sp. kpr-6 TaxID=1761782 RepID=UPI000B86275E|nr:hypothetical protein [Enterobacter sp. kpr-6]
MKAKTAVVIWLSELALLVVVYSFYCAIAPDIWLYDIYTEHYGFVTEVEWYDCYIMALMILSVTTTTLLIAGIAFYFHRNNTRSLPVNK